ncbi:MULTISPECIES: hypothetical protein [Mycobacterium]|uniref:Sodium:proton antiporter n=1 Tax=Mycobacterium persicum TaxID=1487726 RepID=A0AB38URN1_9MYCO|nr:MULTISPECIES: hypothetical protein [Mycobacterium]ORB97088.1 hypothetical protein B1T44_24160 [Mycobacterium persicum]VAZ73921.1 hypothetical protein LAUMK15_02016 [Mycobacterium persicum]VAZ83056.1 hypothetical protein LAUMK42_01868 [Mycobacterium persicum]VAZ91131.1 hypothetical protein LAUMK4_01652 [Mycobacterium persicum]
MSGASKRLPQFVGETGLWWVLSAGVWLATLSARTPAELTVMAGCTLPVAVLARSARRANAGRWQFRIGWLGWLATAARDVVPQAVGVWAHRFTKRSATIRALRLPDETRPVAAARRATAVLTLATTPETVVLQCDPSKQSVLVHCTRVHPGRLEMAVQR